MSNAKYSWLLVLVLVACFSCKKEPDQAMDLSGEWKFQMDPSDQGLQDQWYLENFNETIQLPGSMVENGKGEAITVNTHWTGNMWNDSLWYKSDQYAKYRTPENIKISFWLTPEKKYYGPAWYQKSVTVKESWKNRSISLELERAHWETQLWVDDQLVGSQNRLATAHIYDLTDYLKPGEHVITIRVDNRVKEINPGLDAHSISDNTQTNWNGIVGKIKLVSKPSIHIQRVQILPDIKSKTAKAFITLKSDSSVPYSAKLRCKVKEKKDQGITLPIEERTVTVSGNEPIEITLPMGEDPSLWDEFNPNLYTLTVELETNTGTDKVSEQFGMRAFKAEGKQFTINDRPAFLRGTLECAIFPLTGYPPTEKAEWKRIMNTIKAHGLNHMRFHSWCPPEAAFEAADEIGIYLQVEASAWATIGDGEPIDDWIYEEAESIIDAYGNHPSFVMMAYGNEPHGQNHKAYLSQFLDHFKKIDSGRVYTSAAGWPYLENADFWNTPEPRIQHWAEGLDSKINREPPQTAYDYSTTVEKSSMPVVAHEIGQWCVYPNFKEIDKYTGVLKPKNLEIFKETLEENQMGHLADQFLQASGKLQSICYKADIEAALRTKNLGGFQLLDLHDFPGQGTALVGVLDAFWEEKGYISPAEFRAFCSPTVPLARLEKRIFLNTEPLNAKIEVAHFQQHPIQNTLPSWKLVKQDNTLVQEGSFAQTTIPIGNGFSIGNISTQLSEIKEPEQLTLTVQVDSFSNSWDIWVYPDVIEDRSDESDIRIVNELTPQTVDYLENGGKVLLNVRKGVINQDKGGQIAVGFSSIFWNTSWTNGQPPHTLGILCNPKHPALNYFPTEYHSNWQWWDAMSNSNAIILDDFDSNLKPIVRVIDDWFQNRRTALIFEAKVGKGSLLFSGIDLHNNLEDRPEARQLLFSLKKYIQSKEFAPSVILTKDEVFSLLEDN